MDKIYYGKGKCSIQSNDIVGLEIYFSGAVHIIDKTPPNFHIVAKNNIILIFPYGGTDVLTDLFEYKGYFKIDNILASDRYGKKVKCRAEAVMDFSEKLNTNAEDLDIVSEGIGSNYIYKSSVKETKLDISRIDNLYSNGELYTEKRKSYHGPYHVHLYTGIFMTGATHNKDSKPLFFKNGRKFIKTGYKRGL